MMLFSYTIRFIKINISEKGLRSKSTKYILFSFLLLLFLENDLDTKVYVRFKGVKEETNHAFTDLHEK